MAESNTNQDQEAIDQLVNYTVNMLVNEKKNAHEAIMTLKEHGVDEELATHLVNQISDEIREAKKHKAKNDMLYGGLWCAGGTIATLADIGYIF